MIYELIVLLQTGNFALFESQFLLEFFAKVSQALEMFVVNLCPV